MDGTQAQQLKFEGQVHFVLGAGPPSQTKILGKKESTCWPGEEKKEARILRASFLESIHQAFEMVLKKGSGES